MSTMPMIGMSPRILREVPRELGFRGKTLQYLEQSMAHCLMRLGARVAMIPTIEASSEVERWQVDVDDYCAGFDGLLLQGGADLDPQVYGETITHARGPIDLTRDRFELALLRAFTAADKPVLGVCRGLQLVNVAFGGTLYQDLRADGATSIDHYVAELYDEHFHDIELVPDGWLSRLYGGLARGRINSIHHQGVRQLGQDLQVEARSPDGVVECVRHARLGFAVGVQWHPEFHDRRFPELMPMEPLLQAFLTAAAARREGAQGPTRRAWAAGLKCRSEDRNMGARFVPSRRIIVIACVLAGLVSAYALAGFLVLPRWLKSTATERTQAALGRPLSLGDVAFNPFTLTLTVKDARLADADGAALLGFRRLVIDAELASLWRRGAVLKRIALDGPVVRAVLRPDGTLNLADLSRFAPPPDPKAPPEPAAPLRLAIGELAIGAGELTFADQRRARPFEARLTPVTFTLRAFSSFETDANAWHFDARSAAGETLDFNGTIFLSPLRSQGRFALGAVKATTLASYLADALPFDLVDGELALKGGFTLATADKSTDFAVDLESLDMDRLRVKARGAEEDTVQLERVEVRGGKADVIQRRASLDSVLLRGGRVSLWREASGRTAIDALLGSAGDPGATTAPVTADSAGKAPTPAWRFELGKFGVQQLAASFEDRSMASLPRIELASIALDAGPLSTDLKKPVDASLQVEVASGGMLSVDARLTPDSLESSGKLRLADLDLRPSQPWLAKATQVTLQGGRVSAELDFNRDARGVMNATGTVSAADFATRDALLNQDFVKWRRLKLDGLAWRSEPMRLRIRDVVAQSPYARVVVSPERHLNLSTLLAPPGTAPPAAEATAPDAVAPDAVVPDALAPAPSSPVADIAVERVRIEDGSAHFADLWIKPNFAVALQGLSGTVRGLSSRADTRAAVDIKGTVDRYAPATISGEVNPLAAEVYSDLHLKFSNLEMTTATPYSGHFAGYKIEKGKLNVDLNYRIDHRRIDAKNKFVIDQLQLGEKVESPEATSLPVKLAVALLKDRHGVIDIDLPVTGSLDDPRFRVGPLIWKAFVNLIVKAATAPFALLGSLFGGGDEVNQLLFVSGDATLDETAMARLTTLRKGMVERPGLSLEVPAGWSESDRASMTDARLPVAVEAAWQQQKKQQKLKADIAATPEQLDALREQVRPTVAVSDDELVALGQARAAAIQDALLAGGEVEPTRVFIINVPPLGGDGGKVRLDLALK